MAKYNFSTKSISSELLEAITDAIKNKSYGSVEIYIQDYQVTQITERTIKKLDPNSGVLPDKRQSTDSK
ncbi:DUF2292 domain-containing protein [candidate division WWE3 bacterium]|nr:DUF2292 domain-containing protein [candidate division WWE3 bacterium]